MSAQLVHLLGYLDRDGVTELVISSGRPVAVRVAGAYKPVTQHGVSTQQLVALLDGTAIVHALPTTDSEGEKFDAEVGTRAVQVQIMRRGDELLVRFERGTKPAVAAHVHARAPSPAHAAGMTARTTPVPMAAVRPQVQPPPAAPAAVTAKPASNPALKAPAAARAAATPIAKPSSRPSPFLAAAKASTATTTAAAPRIEAATTRSLTDEPVELTRALADLVLTARERRATDLHVAANRPVMLRVFGDLHPLEPTVKSAAEIDAMLLPLLGPLRRAALESRGYVDLAIDMPGNGRLRANVSRVQNGLKGAFRLTLASPPTLEELGLPKELAKVVGHHQGFVVIAGPSGHGKTTTLAALVDLVNSEHPHHILMIEDPVEIEHPRKAAVISQRELDRTTLSFAAALKASLREDPDVIVIGELRDRETVEIALTAAETGHLVLTTMSTPSAAKTIDRLIDMFPSEDQPQVRASLGGALRAIVAQRLIPAADGGGMIAAVELLTGVLPLAAMIRDNKLFQLPNLMQRGRSFGMIRLDDSLAELVRAGKITQEAALRASDSKRDLALALAGAAPQPSLPRPPRPPRPHRPQPPHRHLPSPASAACSARRIANDLRWHTRDRCVVRQADGAQGLRLAPDARLSADVPGPRRARARERRRRRAVVRRSRRLARAARQRHPDQARQFAMTGDLDFAYAHGTKARFRANYLLKITGPGAVFRVIPSKILTLDELGVPAGIRKLTDLRNGLVLVTGPTGSGKSTTLAAMLDHINRSRAGHILTIEDPVEFVHQPQKCLVTHKEVGEHVPTFLDAIRSAGRENADVILVGELR